MLNRKGRIPSVGILKDFYFVVLFVFCCALQVSD